MVIILNKLLKYFKLITLNLILINKYLKIIINLNKIGPKLNKTH